MVKRADAQEAENASSARPTNTPATPKRKVAAAKRKAAKKPDPGPAVAEEAQPKGNRASRRHPGKQERDFRPRF